MLGHQQGQLLERFFPVFLRLVRVDHRRIQQLTGRIDHGHLTTGAETGIDAQHGLAGQRRLAEQSTQVFGKHVDGVRFAPVAQVAPHIPLDRRQKQAFSAIGNGLLQPGCQGRAHIRAENGFDRAAPVALGHIQLDAQHLLGLAAVERQYLMRAQLVDAHLEVVVQLVHPLFISRVFDLLADHRGPLHGLFAHLPAHLGVIADRLGHDIGRPGPGIFHCGHLVVQEGGRQLIQGLARARLLQDQIRQRLQPLLAGDAGARAPLRLIGLVQVLHCRQGRGRFDLLAQLRGELALFFDRLQDRLAAFVQGAQLFQQAADLAQLFLIQPARGFFAVAGDKWDGVPGVQQLDRSSYLFRTDRKLRCDMLYEVHRCLHMDRIGIIYQRSYLTKVSNGLRSLGPSWSAG